MDYLDPIKNRHPFSYKSLKFSVTWGADQYRSDVIIDKEKYLGITLRHVALYSSNLKPQTN